MKRFITLLIVSNVLSFVGYSQTCDSTLKDINLSINAGLGCCREVEVYKVILKEQDGAISDLTKQIAATEYKYTQKDSTWQTADSLYKVTSKELGKSQQETARVKNGKKNWQIFGVITTAIALIELYAIIKK